METKQEKQSRVGDDLAAIHLYTGWILAIVVAHTICKVLAFIGRVLGEI